MNLRNFKTAKERRVFLEKKLNFSLCSIGNFSLNERKAGSKNCENMIGAAQIPLGVAGPLLLKNEKSKSAGRYYLPLATTEGALVASVNRGCKALREAGGAIVQTVKTGVTRAPVFYTNSLKESAWLEKWVKETKIILIKSSFMPKRRVK